jgi:ribosomal protein S18 acetylase RimI-like enzyme
VPPPIARAASLGISYRPAAAADEAFLRALYASTRAEEVARTNWPEAMRAQFLAQQFDAQDSHYKHYHPQGEWLIVERDGAPAGRLYLDEAAGRLNVIDIALAPEARGRGVGSAILADILADAGRRELKVILYVDPGSPAKRLYSRLGFARVEGDEMHELMEWPAEGAALA